VFAADVVPVQIVAQKINQQAAWLSRRRSFGSVCLKVIETFRRRTLLTDLPQLSRRGAFFPPVR
jgi:hypothetical protein